MKLQVILGSTRPGRVSERIANWVVDTARDLPDTDVELVDLADYKLPFLDEAISPRYNPNRTPNLAAKKWLDKVGQADAYVLVTPEYNRSYSAVLKNAIDYIDFQMEKKPVALVAHGSTGGAQAVAHLRGVMTGIHAVTVPAATYLIQASQLLDEQGNLSEAAKANPYGPAFALKQTLDSTKWYSDALAAARAKQ
jgi:NAD(P)H-dependent FMN reductase